MSPNLESLRAEIEEYLSTHDLIVFRGYPRLLGSSANCIYWDSQNYPDFRQFLATAQSVGVRLLCLHTFVFGDSEIEETSEQLSNTDLEPAERHQIEARLHELESYTGFVCQIELSFDHGPRTYVFELATRWYDEFKDLMDQIEDSYRDVKSRSPLGGYFSSNN